MTKVQDPPFAVGQTVWLPFWSLLDYIGEIPSAPFVRCEIITIGPKNYIGQDGGHYGKMMLEVADLKVAKDLIAYAIPSAYLIREEDLGIWTERIGRWFSSFRVDDAS